MLHQKLAIHVAMCFPYHFRFRICRDVEVEDGCFTGRYLGELAEVKFRKIDLLKLMAEREGSHFFHPLFGALFRIPKKIYCNVLGCLVILEILTHLASHVHHFCANFTVL